VTASHNPPEHNGFKLFKAGAHTAQDGDIQELTEQQWKMDYVCLNVYLVRGVYDGKLAFTGWDPEEVYDIDWNFNPDVVLEGTNTSWIFATLRGHDLWDKARCGNMMEDGDSAQLTDEQIS